MSVAKWYTKTVKRLDNFPIFHLILKKTLVSNLSFNVKENISDIQSGDCDVLCGISIQFFQDEVIKRKLNGSVWIVIWKNPQDEHSSVGINVQILPRALQYCSLQTYLHNL